MTTIPSEEGAAPESTSRKLDPARLELRTRPRPVTRLNRNTIAILAGTVMLGTLLVILWGLRPPHHKVPEPADVKRAPERVTRAPGLATLPRDYANIPQTEAPTEPRVPQLGPPLGEFGQPIGSRSSATRATGSTTRRIAQPHTSTDSAQNGDSAIFFELIRPNDATRSGSRRPNPTQSDPGRTASGNSHDDSIYASGTLQNPRSPRQLMAGTLIRAALLTGINSDLPGQIIATVVENVFDTATGTLLLIPQGSRLLGKYSDEGAYGQRRVQLVWTRLIRPDGSSVLLNDLPGVDAAGYAGLEDQVDTHLNRVFAGAAVSTLLGVGTELASPQRTSSNGAVIIAARDSVHDTINDAGQQISRRTLNMPPTRTIRPGFPVHVIINKDLIL